MERLIVLSKCDIGEVHDFVGHITYITHQYSLVNSIRHGYIEGKRKRRRSKRNWMNDIFEFSHLSLRQLLNTVKDCLQWKKLCYTISCDPATITTSWDEVTK